jgi:hypothetical protein
MENLIKRVGTKFIDSEIMEIICKNDNIDVESIEHTNNVLRNYEAVVCKVKGAEDARKLLILKTAQGFTVYRGNNIALSYSEGNEAITLETIQYGELETILHRVITVIDANGTRCWYFPDVMANYTDLRDGILPNRVGVNKNISKSFELHYELVKERIKNAKGKEYII